MFLNQIQKKLGFDKRKDFERRAKEFEKEYQEFYIPLMEKWHCRYVLKVALVRNGSAAIPIMTIADTLEEEKQKKVEQDLHWEKSKQKEIK